MLKLLDILKRYKGTEILAPLAVGVKNNSQKVCDTWLFCKCDCSNCDCNCNCDCYQCYGGD